MNYDDLKKFLLKEYNAAQAQQILAEHAAKNNQPHTNFMNFNPPDIALANPNVRPQQSKSNKAKVLASKHSIPD